MRLVEIAGLYINPDRVDAVTHKYIHGEKMGTAIYTGGAEEPFTVNENIEKVVKALSDTREEMDESNG